MCRRTTEDERGKRRWDEELAVLQDGGMPFDEALARMRARREGEAALPELTTKQIEMLSDQDIFEFALPLLDRGVPLDAVCACLHTCLGTRLCACLDTCPYMCRHRLLCTRDAHLDACLDTCLDACLHTFLDTCLDVLYTCL